METTATRRSRRPLVALVATAALIVAACGGTSPTAPASSSTAPAETPIDVPTFDDGTLSLPSFEIPSFEADKDLEALLPDSIGGNLVIKLSMTGPAIRNFPGGAALEAQLGAEEAGED